MASTFDGQSTSLELEVWREACRHIEISDAAARIAPIVARFLPVDVVLVRTVELRERRLDTVAVGECRRVPVPASTRNDVSAAAMDAVAAWARTGRVLETGDPLFESLLPEPLAGTVLAGPLVDEGGLAGVLVLLATPPRALGKEHVPLVQSLLEPFSVALDNDRRLQELARLRDAVMAENRALLTRLERQEIVDSIVGAGTGLHAVMSQVDQVAPTDAPVLIIGETGSGKEVIARAIHARSRRAAGAIVRVNCGAIPGELVDSELFGHEKGSFTGAVGTRRGWFERADGGTLFLDEVGELPLAAQVRLLRILQDGSLERVGSQRSLRVDVRIVAATHRDLASMVKEGAFREDLLYRIGVFPLRLPPLRERPGDLPELAAHFAARVGKRMGGSPLGITEDDVAHLVAYDWPGNVRELAAVIERAAILGNGRRLEIGAALGVRGLPAPRLGAPPTSSGSETKLDTLDRAMAAHIERALERTKGRIEGAGGAAALLDINPHTLRARMRKLRVRWEKFRA